MVLGHRAPDYHGARYKFGHDGARAPGTRCPCPILFEAGTRYPGARCSSTAVPEFVAGTMVILCPVPEHHQKKRRS